MQCVAQFPGREFATEPEGSEAFGCLSVDTGSRRQPGCESVPEKPAGDNVGAETAVVSVPSQAGGAPGFG